MAQPFEELRERLLRAGVAPRHVRRYVRELADHLADLRAEEEQAGRSRENALAAARARLGGVDALAQAMIRQRRFQSWSARAPWAMFSLGALGLLGAAYFFACLYLWCGWKWFVPGADSPFGSSAFSMYSLPNIYFQAGKFYYTWAPVLAAWVVGLAAVRQRLRAAWPILAFLLMAAMGATANIQASRTAVPGLGHIRMSFFTLTSASFSGRLIYAGVVLTLAVLPYLLARWHQARSLPR